MIRIEIQDFQSIASVVLEVSGFAALVGRSNIGKSAVIRAVRAVLTNAQGVQDVRHGPTCARHLRGVKTCKCKAQVHIVGPGFDILWEKGDADSRYTINGTVYEAVPKGTPDFLKQWFQPVKIGEKSMLLQVASQWDPLFLLDASGPAVADVLSDVAQLDRINVASRLVEKDRREAQATIKVREKDIQATCDALVLYTGLDGVVQRMEDLTTSSVGLQATQKATEKVLQLLAAKQVCDTTITYLEPVETLVFPAKVPVLKAVQIWDYLIDKGGELAAKEAVVHKLELVEALYVPSDRHLTRTVKAAEGMLDWLTSLRAIKAIFTQLTGVCRVEPPNATQLQERASQVGVVVPLAEQLVRLRSDVAAMGGEQDKLNREEQALRQELQAFKTCPLCDQSMEGFV